MWIKEIDDRLWDELGLVAVSDTPMPRIFFMDSTPRFVSTVSYSLHIFGTTDDWVDVASKPLLIEGDSDAIRSGSYDQRGKIWSSSGALLAVTNQIAFFR